MAGGRLKYRHLSRSSSHRVAMLRNMVTSLIEHERLETTWHKAKEVQRIADKLITLAKRNTEATRRRAIQICYRPNEMVPKLFGPIRERYMTRPGGYTRVLRIESVANDHAQSAILELVGNARDMRRATTALTLARMRRDQRPMNDITNMNVKKATQFDPQGTEKLERMVDEFESANLLGVDKESWLKPPEKKDVGQGSRWRAQQKRNKAEKERREDIEI